MSVERPPRDLETVRQRIAALTGRNAPPPTEIAGGTPATEADAPAFAFTDTGNAERLVHRFGPMLRHHWGRGRWYTWTGTHWADDTTGRMDQLAKQTVRAIPFEADGLEEDQRAKVLRWSAASESAGKRNAMIELARSEPGIPAQAADFDQDPWLLNVANGTIDLRTGALRSHEPADMITRIVPVRYNPDASCPVFTSMLDRIFAGDTELIGYVQRMIGYSLTGSIREQAIFINYGTGANGKSTLLNAIAALLDSYATHADTDTFLQRDRDGIREDVAALDGARFVTASETSDGKRLSEAFVKKVTGGELIRCRRLYENGYTFAPQFKVWLATNHRPVIAGTDHAIWRRIRLIPFLVTIPEAERDRDLPARLEKELPGILAWAVAGCRAWIRGGEQPPATVLQATEQYRHDMDALANWLDDRCELRPGLRTTTKALYGDYLAYCTESGEEPLKQRTFGLRLTERGIGDAKSMSVRYRTGIRLRDSDEPTQASFEDDESGTQGTQGTQFPGVFPESGLYEEFPEVTSLTSLTSLPSQPGTLNGSSPNGYHEDPERDPWDMPGASGDDRWTR